MPLTDNSAGARPPRAYNYFTEFQAATTGARPALAVASYAVGVGELDATPPRGEASPRDEPPEPEVMEAAEPQAAEPAGPAVAELARGKGSKGWRRIGRRRPQPVAPTSV